MKKYLNYTYMSLATILFLCNACEDYLSELPDNRTQIDTPEKISELLVAAYPESCYMDIAETMSDNVGDKGNRPDQLNEIMYNWETTDIDDLDHPLDYWNACYKAIAQANQALFSIKELGSPASLNPQKGEALLARAYGHFMLVNFWGKHYNPTTSNTDLGIPYVLEPETEFLVEYKRNTVQEVYDLVERDLLEGLSLVTNDYDQPAYHFTPASGNAFATRFYLFKGDWENVIRYSSQVLSSNPSTQLKDIIGTYNELEASQRFALYSSERDLANLLIVSAPTLYARSVASNNYGLSFSILEEFFFSRNILNKDQVYELFGGESTARLPKFEELFVFTNLSAGIGIPNANLILFSIDEVLLSRAEAYAMNDQFDLALADLDSFLSVRTEGYDSSTDKLTNELILSEYPAISNEFKPYYDATFTAQQRSYVKAVAELKRREFCHEGLRWFDVRRLNIRVIHEFLNGQDAITLEQDDNRRQLQIPQPAIATGITANPR